MRKRNPWARGTTKAQMYLMIAAAGARGITRNAIAQALQRSGNAITYHMADMERDGFAHSDGARYYKGKRMPPIEGLLALRALDLIEDCPVGIGEALICRELGTMLAELHQALEPFARAGRIERIVMPARYGGGMGWAIPKSGVEVAVFECDIDRIHRVHAEADALPAFEPPPEETLH